MQQEHDSRTTETPAVHDAAQNRQQDAQPLFENPGSLEQQERPILWPRVQRQSRMRLLLIASLSTLLALVSATVLVVFSVAQPAVPATAQRASGTARLVGSLAFTDSGQLDPTSSQGQSDVVTMDLHQVAPPLPGNSYDAWLLADPTDQKTQPLLLGTLAVSAGKAHLDYTSPTHTNLLATFSRLRVTEQEAGTAPATPSPEPSTWRYVGDIPNTPTPGDEMHYSLLSHLRHLLARDPTLQSLGLGGGLDIWLYRNVGKLVEYATATRDDWPNKGAGDLMHRQIVRILDYLDGSAYVWQDVWAGTPELVDPKAGRLGLLEMTPTQNPPGYLAHVDIHLQGLANSIGHTEGQHRLAIQLDQVLTSVSASLQSLRKDARELVKMQNQALQQQHALDLINEMVALVTSAYVGQPDPATGEITGGVSFLHNHLQGLATMPILTLTLRKGGNGA